MKKFIGNNFLLSNSTAKQLYHNTAKSLPIIDYHCHVSPKEIAEDKTYRNITELWLGGDHYKWRAMRSCGIAEEYITGNASDYDKFRSYAKIMPRLIGNPLYHWSHLELKQYFDYGGALNEDTCDDVWEHCNEMLTMGNMSVRRIIKNSGVEALCTTDDPCDSLEYHRAIAEDDSFGVRVLPAFRPDKGINLERVGYADYIRKLCEAAGMENISTIEQLQEAYRRRLDFFSENGCLTADHGIDETIPFTYPRGTEQLNEIFAKALQYGGKGLGEEEIAAFKVHMLLFFAKEYKNRDYVMQLHFGVLRNVNTEMFGELGPDTGYDIIGGRTSVTELARLLDLMHQNGGLPRTVLYSVNPADNAAVGALLGAFQCNSEGGLPRVMQGSAWWFCDCKKGMEEQMTSLASLSALGCFTGMLTDSRSFISYTRHEYFRRILCNLFGEWVENGEYPYDMDTLEELVGDICYYNTKKFFRF